VMLADTLHLFRPEKHLAELRTDDRDEDS
jgi:hypothetical protein